MEDEQEIKKEILNLNRGLTQILEKIGEVAKSLPRLSKLSIDSFGSVSLESETLSMNELIKKSLEIRNKLNDGLSLKKVRTYFG